MQKNDERLNIAVILASMEVEYVRSTLEGIIQQAELCNINLYLFNTFINADESLKHNIGEYNLYSLINYDEFDGVILFANMIQGHNAFFKVAESIRNSGVPTVCIDTSLDNFCHIGTDGYQGMRQVVEHLIEDHGYRKLYYLSGLDFNSDSRERLRAFCDVLAEKGMSIEENYILKGSFTYQSGRENARRILAMKEELPDAVICATDSIAMGVRSIFEEHGIKIPQQVALAGFDNSFEAKYSVPALTTVTHNQQLIGKKAMEKLNQFIRFGIEMESEDLPAQIVIGESCGCIMEKQVDATEIRKMYINVTEAHNRALLESNLMVESLNDSESYEDFLERLKIYVEKLQCKSFYLCLNYDLVKDLKNIDNDEFIEKFYDNHIVEGYPPTMTVAMAYEDGEYKSYPDFPVTKMWPEHLSHNHDRMKLIFSPIHFKEYTMGYVIIENSEFAMNSAFYHSWLIHLSNSLENIRRRAKQRYLLQRLDSMYVRDSLTGLYNRFGFSRYTNDSFLRCMDEHKNFMVLFVDLNGLKMINDKYGHNSGDLAIKVVADALKNTCEGQEVCARFGGDEYLVYAEGYAEYEAGEFCHRFEEQMKQANVALSLPFPVNASYGYVIGSPKPGDNLDHYINKADDKMYKMKEEIKRYKK